MKSSLRLNTSIAWLLSLGFFILAAIIPADVRANESTQQDAVHMPIPDTSITLILPPDAVTLPLVSNPAITIVEVHIPSLSNISLVAMVTPRVHADGIVFSSLNSGEMNAIKSAYTPNIQDTSHEVMGDLLEDREALRLYGGDEDDRISHLIAGYEDHLIALLVDLPKGSVADEKAVLSLQETILQDTFSALMEAERQDEYYMEACDIRLIVPPNAMIQPMGKEADNLTSLMFHPAHETVYVAIYAQKNALYDGYTVNTLDPDILASILDSNLGDDYDPATIHIIDDYFAGTPVVSCETPDDGYHLITLKDDWAITITAMFFTYADPSKAPIAKDEQELAWAQQIQQGFMRQVLGERPKRDDPYGLGMQNVTIDDDMVTIPMGDVQLLFSIPDGYVTGCSFPDSDTFVFGARNDDATREYIILRKQIAFDTSITTADLLDNPGANRYLTELSRGIKSDPATRFWLSDDVFQGTPAICITSEDDIVHGYALIHDGFLVYIRFLSERNPVTQDDSVALRKLITLESSPSAQPSQQSASPIPTNKKIK